MAFNPDQARDDHGRWAGGAGGSGGGKRPGYDASAESTRERMAAHDRAAANERAEGLPTRAQVQGMAPGEGDVRTAVNTYEGGLQMDKYERPDGSTYSIPRMGTASDHSDATAADTRAAGSSDRNAATRERMVEQGADPDESVENVVGGQLRAARDWAAGQAHIASRRNV